MNVWAYCGADWVAATRSAGGVEPLTSPPHDAESITAHLAKASQAQLVYLNLHGYLGQPHLYGQQDGVVGPTALTTEAIAAQRWDGVVVFAEVCFSAAEGGPVIADAFLRNGARAFVGSTTEAYGRTHATLWDGEADRLMSLFRRTYHSTNDPKKALVLAKKLLKAMSYPLDDNDRATLRSFVCLTEVKEKS